MRAAREVPPGEPAAQPAGLHRQTARGGAGLAHSRAGLAASAPQCVSAFWRAHLNVQ